ncbi:MAG: GLPGLI family protein, partial [Polaribacter sp.]|nr:GLPGLI family protein [Polaribacter sp.]
MKIKLITMMVLFLSFTMMSQNFTGKAIYKTSRKSDFKIGGENSTMSEKQTKEIEARLQKMNQKTYTLTFSTYESIYKEDVKLNDPKPRANAMNVMVFGDSGGTDVYYKNIKEKRFANKTAIMGKPFLVKDSLPIYDWRLKPDRQSGSRSN